MVGRILAVVFVVVVCACGGPASSGAGGRPRNPGQTDTCDPHPAGLPGTFMVKFDAGFNYQPQGGNIQPRILEDFQYPLFEALDDSAVEIIATDSMQSDIHIFVGVQNDGNNNFHVVVNVSGAGTPSPGMLLQYFSPTYPDAVQALNDAAKATAGFLASGWTCT